MRQAISFPKHVIFALSLAFLVLMYSCASKQQQAFLNLSYTPKEKVQTKTDIKIAVVKPVYSLTQKVMQSVTTSPLSSLLEQAMPADYKLKSKYYSDYVQRLRNAMTVDLEEIASAKGLIVVKTFDNFDEITFNEKKSIDYVLMPEFDFGPVVKNKRQCFPVVGCIDKGTIQMIGSFTLVFYEPMSREKIIIKKIDMSSLGYSSAIEYSGFEDADNKLMELLNEIYAKLMSKVETLIDVEELKQNLKNVKQLKGQI